MVRPTDQGMTGNEKISLLLAVPRGGGTPGYVGLHGKRQGWSEGRGSEEKLGKSLSFLGRKWVRQDKQI